LDEYLARHREDMAKGRLFPWTEYEAGALTPERRQEILQALAEGPVYLTGGFSEELKGKGGIERTPYGPTALPHGLQRIKNAR
jgi:hypothetical protein